MTSTYLYNSFLGLVALVVLQRWVSKTRFNRTPPPPSLSDRRPKPSAVVSECPLCCQTMQAACEAIPCRHSFCGRCLLDHWHAEGYGSLCPCPVDGCAISLIVPDYELRKMCSVRNTFVRCFPELQTNRASEARVDFELANYNVKFASTSSSNPIVNIRMAQRMYYDLPYLNVVMKLVYLIAVTAALAYFLYPVDALPESKSGIFYAFHLADDVAVAVLCLWVLGGIYRYFHLFRSSQH